MIPLPLILLLAGSGVLAWTIRSSPVAPTGFTIALLAAAALVATLAGTAGMLTAMGAVLLLFITDAFLSRGDAVAQRECATTLPRGYPSTMKLRVQRSGAGRMTVGQPRVGDIWMEHLRARHGFVTTMRPKRRGRIRIPPAWIRATGPFELAAWRIATNTETHIRVLPDLPRAERIRAAVRTNTFRDPSERRRGPLGLGTEFELVRDYVPDDDIRQVNWRATMRTGRAMSNQYRLEQDRDIICLIDIGRLMAASIGDASRIDLAVDAVVALTRVADDMGDRTGVIAFDSSLQRDLRPRRRAFDVVLHHVFDLEASEKDSDFELAFRAVGHRKRAMIFVFTDFQDEAAARSLLDAAPYITRQHQVVIAAVQDPAVQPSRSDVSGAPITHARNMVRDDLAQERLRVEARLQGSGAHTIDCEAATFVEACVGQYLWAKRNARL